MPRNSRPVLPGGLRFEMPVAEAPGWRVSWLVIERDGERLLADFRVFAGSSPAVCSGGRVGTWEPTYPVPTPGITAKLLRLISIAELSELAEVAIYNQTNPGVSEQVNHALRDIATKLAPARARTGRKGTPDADYLVFAQLYHQAKTRPSKTPVKDVAAQLGWPTRGKVRDLIHQCRVRDLLTADGWLTNYALELAAGQAEEG